MTVNIEEIKSKLIEKLRGTGWDDKLKGFIFSSDFSILIKALEDKVNDGKNFTPKLKDVFSALIDCPYDKVKLVIIGQDPYPQINIADGKAFSCSKSMLEQPSLTYMFDSIYKTTGKIDRNPDLTRWSNQGILLLNYALTCEIGKPGTHYKIWEPFIAYLLDIISSEKDNIDFIFMGKVAQGLESLVSDKHDKIFTSHPISAGYSGKDNWDCNDCFNKVNKSLDSKGRTIINW